MDNDIPFVLRQLLPGHECKSLAVRAERVAHHFIQTLLSIEQVISVVHNQDLDKTLGTEKNGSSRPSSHLSAAFNRWGLGRSGKATIRISQSFF